MRYFGLRLVIVAMLVALWLARPLALGSDDLFDGNQVHDIWLRINSKDWAQLRDQYKENTYYPGDLEWNGIVVANAGIRSRGRASRSGQKPGLRIDFNRYVAGQEFLGLKSLDLDNLAQDPSMIHERLAMLLFQRMGLPAPRETHARLYVGGGREFAGVYGVVEPIDKAFLKRHFDNNDGFLYNYQWQDPYFFDDRADLAWYAPRFEPKTHESESMYDLFSPIRRLVHAVNDASESALESDLRPFIDVRKFITYIGIENVLSEPDGLLGGLGMANFYLYRFDGTDLLQFIPWDKDLSFEHLETPFPDHNINQNVLSRKLWAVPELKRAYLQTLLAVSTSVGPPAGTPAVQDASTRECPAPPEQPPCGWLETEVFREYALIREAALSDSHSLYTNEQFEQAIASLKDFARQRSALVRGYVGQVAPELAVASRVRQ